MNSSSSLPVPSREELVDLAEHRLELLVLLAVEADALPARLRLHGVLVHVVLADVHVRVALEHANLEEKNCDAWTIKRPPTGKPSRPFCDSSSSSPFPHLDLLHLAQAPRGLLPLLVWVPLGPLGRRLLGGRSPLGRSPVLGAGVGRVRVRVVLGALAGLGHDHEVD